VRQILSIESATWILDTPVKDPDLPIFVD